MLPVNLDYLIEQTYAWFARSSKRQSAISEIYKVINDEEKPKKILRFCKTRWLSRYQCVARIVDQWKELKLYFQSCLSEKSVIIEQLVQMYNDNINFIYLTYLASILKFVNEANIKFQSENANPLKLVDNLIDCYEKVLQPIVMPTYFHRLKVADLRSFKFETKLRPREQIEASVINNLFFEYGILNEERKTILGHCLCFMTKLGLEIRDRLPDSLEALELLRLLDPLSAMSVETNSIRPLLTRFSNIKIDHDLAVSEYGLLNKGNWDRSSFRDPLSFWLEVLTKEGNEDGRFQNICRFALALFCLPLSNAAVERVFSTMNIVKTKLRNSMQFEVVDSILCIRYGLAWRGENCTSFTVSDAMLELFNVNMYGDDDSNFDNGQNDDEDDVFSVLRE